MSTELEFDSVFQVQCSADLAMTHIELSEREWRHILLGHRNLLNQVSGIRHATEAPTRIYKSSQHHYDRFELVSDDVKNAGGHPMHVIVQRQADHGKVITATFKSRPPNSPIVWEKSNNNIYSNHDAENDVFYISRDISCDEFADDCDVFEGVWLRRSTANGAHTGVTVFGLRQFGEEGVGRLIGLIADFLTITSSDIEFRLRPVRGDQE